MNTRSYSPIVELRQYTLHPERRDELIELFDREFVETQEAVGMQVIGQFRNIDDPDQFVWLRGFNDMSARAGSLAAFYGGPIWKAHRDAANAKPHRNIFRQTCGLHDIDRIFQVC